MSANNGGPAFPQPAIMGEREIISSADYGEGGMTMRDYFAAKAMQAELMFPDNHVHDDDWAIGVASTSYAVADAMLKYRTEGGV